jgi:simple sugar transport system permease protein
VAGVVVLWLAAHFWDDAQTTAVASRTVRAAAPLLLGALCAVICERSGVINIGIEGQMLFGAYAGFMAASYTGSLVLGIATAIVSAMTLGLFLAWSAVTLRMDQIIAGTVINIFALGLTTFYYVAGRTMPNFPRWTIPALADIPVIGRALFSHGPLTYVAFIAAVVVFVALFYTRWGLRTRAVGEHPSAADTVGIRVPRARYINVVIAASLAGLAGMHLVQSATSFNRGMTNGQGFIALAVMIFGRWHPITALAGALLFGLFQGIQAQLQFRQALDIPPQFFGMIPYVVTIAVLAIAGLGARPPASVGKPYEKE